MQQVSITIDTDNAAFGDGAAGYEVARILKELATEIELGNVAIEDESGKRLRDVNGNYVGKMIVEGRRAADEDEDEESDE